MITARKAFERWYSNQGEWPQAVARGTATEYQLADQIRRMWFTKLRSKAADDVADLRGEQAASDLLGHDDVRTTRRHYLTRGKRVGPTR